MTLQDLGTATFSGSASALNADLLPSTKVIGYETASVHITGTFVGVISFQGSNNNIDFENVYAQPAGTPNNAQPVVSTTLNGIYHLPLNFEYFRVRMTSYTSGTATATVVIYERSIGEPIGPQLADAFGNPLMVSLSGTLKAASPTKLVGETFFDGVLDPNVWTTTTTGTGSITVANSTAQLATGATANSSIFLTSTRLGRFFSGTTNAFKGSIKLGDTGTVNNIRRWGAYTSTSGVFFQLNGTTFGIGIRYASSDTIITSFNGVPPVVDTNFHRYEIQYTENRALFFQDGLLIHSVSATTTTLTGNPSLYVGIENTNSGGSTSNVSLLVANTTIHRYGEAEARPRFFHSNFIGRIQSNSSTTVSNSNSQSVTVDSTTAGSCIIVAVAVSTNAVATVTDNQGQTYTQATSISDTASGFSYIYYRPNTVAGVTSITATLGVGINDSIQLVAAEYSAVNTSSPLDKTSTQANPGATALTSGSTATTSQAVELLFGSHYTNQNANDPITPGSGWTAIATIGAQNHQLYAQDQIVTTIGTYASTGTANASHNFYSSIATFKITIPNNALTPNFPQTLKIGPGTLKRVVVNNPGTGNAFLTLYDNTTNSGSIIGVLDLAVTIGTFDFDLDFDNGLTIVVSSSSADFTVVYD